MELKKILKNAVLACVVAFGAVACSQDGLFDEVAGPTDGKTTLRLSAVEFTGEAITRATVTDAEKAIKSAWVVQFDNGGTLMGTPKYYTTFGTGNTVEAELDPVPSTVYVVANVPATAFSSFTGNKTAFENAAVTLTSEITTTAGLPMVGSAAVTASSTSVSVQLTRACARIDLTVTNSSDVTALKLNECYLTYVPNTVAVKGKTAGAGRVYPTTTTDGTFIGGTATGANKFVYGTKQSLGGLTKGQNKKVTWYVSENLAGQQSSITAAKFKGEKNAPAGAMRIVINGTCTYKGTPNTAVTFTVFPGANATTDFNVQRNYVYTVTSTVKGMASADNRISVATTDLSASGTANCYMIHKGGKYKFKCTVPGNGKIYRLDAAGANTSTLIDAAVSSATISGTAAEILWQGSGDSYQTGNATTSIIKNVTVDNGYIVFETADTFAEGNALIALKNGATTVWSWHIWATLYDPDTNTANVDTYTLSSAYASKTSEAVMRCNLGATGQTATGMGAETTAPQCYGLKYQWGRKDPFWHTSTNGTWVNGATKNIDAKGSSGMVSNSIKNPTQFYIQADGTNYDWIGPASQKNDHLWGNGVMAATNITIVHGASGTTTRVVNKNRGGKSVFDPCPVGWRVPPQALWTNCGITSVANNYVAAAGAVPAYLKLLSNVGRNPVKYPAAGYLNRETGTVSNVGSFGNYWSSSPYSSEVYAGYLVFNSGGVYPVSDGSRAYGFSVRCVRE